MIWEFRASLVDHYAHFDPDVVVYDDISGHTHVLTPPLSSTFLHIVELIQAQRPCTNDWFMIELRDGDIEQFQALAGLGILRSRPR